jgi:hypothetical protein
LIPGRLHHGLSTILGKQAAWDGLCLTPSGAFYWAVSSYSNKVTMEVITQIPEHS